MEELAIKEKAKRYDEALEKARSIRFGNPQSGTANTVCEEIFPELKESEDERISKEIIKYLEQTVPHNHRDEVLKSKEWTAWLEKQGEQEVNEPDWCHHKVDLSDCSEEYRKAYYDGWNNCNQQHSQCNAEQKSADKAKPKFKVDDLVVDNNGKVAIIYDLQKAAYVGHYTDGTDFICKYNNEYLLHLWTIADAKDGDVLDANGAPFIYKKHSKDYVYFYCGVNLAGDFIEANGIDTWDSNNKVHPATKKQRDLLFAKMKEAGYEWDAEKKELKRIEYKHICELDNSYACVTFPFKAKVKSSGAIVTIHGGQLSHDCKEWIKYQSDAEDGYKVYEPNNLELVCEIEQNPAWSEEDEYWHAFIAELLYGIEDSDKEYEAKCREAANWLKSLKQRVQPKQKLNEHDNYVIDKVLDWATFVNPTSSIFEKLPKKQFIESLKSLKQRIGG